MNRIAVIDALEGDVGSKIIKAIRLVIGKDTEIWALGANANATAQMMKSGAHLGVTGEAAICHSVREANLIAGSLSIIICHALMGEITPRMVDAICTAKAPKILLPTDELVQVVGAQPGFMPQLVQKLVGEHLKTNGHGIKRLVNGQHHGGSSKRAHRGMD